MGRGAGGFLIISEKFCMTPPPLLQFSLECPIKTVHLPVLYPLWARKFLDAPPPPETTPPPPTTHKNDRSLSFPRALEWQIPQKKRPVNIPGKLQKMVLMNLSTRRCLTCKSVLNRKNLELYQNCWLRNYIETNISVSGALPFTLQSMNFLNRCRY